MRLLISAQAQILGLGRRAIRFDHTIPSMRASTTADLAPTARSRMPSQAPAAIDWRDAIPVPPRARTVGSRNHSDKFSGVIPPVGIVRIPRCAKGARIARISVRPPAGKAGKNLKTDAPAFNPIWISLGVMTPG